MTEEPELVHEYRCVRCVGPLDRTGPALQCRRCTGLYPLIGESGIPILVRRPQALLTASMRAVGVAQARASRMEADFDDLRPVDGTTSAPNAARAALALRGTSRDAVLVGRSMEPVATHLDASDRGVMTPLDWIAAHAGGWPGHVSLAMFYQDWGNTRGANQATSLILDALLHHRPDARAVAVLGSGAGGLVHACAPHFAVVYGVDLSVPTTLLARSMLHGDSMTLHLKDAEWRAVQVTGAAAPSASIELAVADAAALPFGDATLSAVVTQYLMDLVGNPLAVASEITRVLVPGGVWINFSMPFTLPDEPAAFGAPTLDELPVLLRPLGLSVAMRERCSFTFLDMTDLDAHAKRVSQPVHFFAAHKTSHKSSQTDRPRVMATGLSDEEWWRGVPCLMPGREVHLSRVSAFAPDGRRDSLEARAGGGTAQVPASLASAIERLFGLIDGRRTLKEIFDQVTSHGLSLGAEDFGELFVYLTRHYGSVTIRQPLPC